MEDGEILLDGLKKNNLPTPLLLCFFFSLWKISNRQQCLTMPDKKKIMGEGSSILAGTFRPPSCSTPLRSLHCHAGRCRRGLAGPSWRAASCGGVRRRASFTGALSAGASGALVACGVVRRRCRRAASFNGALSAGASWALVACGVVRRRCRRAASCVFQRGAVGGG